jgi:hypothetical protein
MNGASRSPRPSRRAQCDADRQVSGRSLDDVVTGNALDAADRPLLAGIDRTALPVGERGLGEHAGLHGHVVLDDDFLAADRLRDAGQRVAHQGDDGDLHVGLALYCAGPKPRRPSMALLSFHCADIVQVRADCTSATKSFVIRDVPALSMS